MTLSAVSMQMKALETELGVDLFDRTVRPPRLTPIGRTVVEAAIPLLQREDSLLEICRPTDTLVGHFRIGFVTTAAVRLLPDFLKNAKQNAPRATFAFETGLSKALQEKVVSGQLDAAIVTDAEGVPDALAELVLREEPFVFAAHENLLNDGLAGLLRQHSFFHFMPDTGIGKLIAGEMLKHERPKGAETIVLDNLEAIMECVSAGLGLRFCPLPMLCDIGPPTSKASVFRRPRPENWFLPPRARAHWPDGKPRSQLCFYLTRQKRKTVRLRTHSQLVTSAARVIAERKTFGQRPSVINATLAGGLGEEGFKVRHLRGAQPEKIRHVTARFSSRESCR